MEEPTLSELARSLDRIEHLLATDIADHESRIRLIERRMWVAVGAAGGLSTLSTLLGISAIWLQVTGRG